MPNIERPVRLTLLADKGVLMCFEAARKSQKKWLHFYSLDSIKLIRSVINNGPNEGELLSAFQLQYDKRNGGEIYITDVVKQQIIVYKADSLIAGNETPFKILGRLFDVNQAPTFDIKKDRLVRTIVTDSSYNLIDTRVSQSNYSQMLFNKYRSDLSVRDSFGYYPKTEQNTLPNMIGQVLDGCIGLSTDIRYLVYSSLTTDYLSVYDTSGKIIASAIGPGDFDVSYKKERIGSAERVVPMSIHKGYLGSAEINDGFVYALYDGKDSRNNDEHTSELFQFSIQLHPEIRYKLKIPVFDFEIDWNTGRLYGLRKEGLISQLVIYKL